MVDYSFIRLHTSTQEAFNLQQSPNINLSYYGQVQLLPRDKKPYFQTTQSSVDVDIDPTAFPQTFLVDCRGNEENITAHVTYAAITDINGIKQIAFRISDLPTDHGSDLVYLKVVSTSTYYSNKFLVSEDSIYPTSRLDYKDIRGLRLAGNAVFDNFKQSVRLQFYFDRHVDSDTLETYFQITRGQNVNARVDFADLKQWAFPFVDAWTWKRLKRAFYSGTAYIDFIRNYPTEAFEYSGRLERSNISEETFITDPYEDDVLSVADVEIIDPTLSTLFLTSSALLTSTGKLISDEFE